VSKLSIIRIPRLCAALLSVCAGLSGVWSGSTALAAPTAAGGAHVADPREQLASKLPGTRVEDLRATPVAGLYELTRGAEIAYVTADGKYVLSGDLIEVASADNLTEQRRKEARSRLIGAFPETDMIVFAPRTVRYTVTVFTDVDCAYCRELHSQIAEYNRLGIRVRYVSYPRSGPDSESWTKAEKVWCAANRNEALTLAKRGAPPAGKVCANNPVAREYALGREIALQGTPAIVTASGEMLSGYVAPAELLQHLQKSGG
jgi:thiol:disulfide interchange protein DsbC